MNILEINHVIKEYENKKALDSISLNVNEGRIFGLLGPNGAGKSTLFKALMGFIPSARGKISLLGYSVKDALKNNLIAYVPQSEEVDWDFPVLVKDVVLMGRYGKMGFMRRARAEDLAIVKKSLERVGMLDFEDRQIGELSGGQRKRVFLARALAQEGKVILLDEPFTGVDVKTEEQIISLLKDLKKEGHIMIVSTHNLGSVPEFCDRTIFVKGTVISHGLTDDVFTNLNLEKAFGGVLRRFTLGGSDLHDDSDQREITILTDDERPFVQYGEPKKSVTKRNKIDD